MILTIVSFGYITLVRHRIRLDQLDLAILAFLSVMVVRFILDLFGPYPMAQSLTITAQLILAVAFFYALASLPIDRSRLLVLLRFWILVILVLTVYGFYQTFARNFGLPLANITIGAFHTVDANLFGFQRPTSLFQEPTQFSAFVLPGYVFVTYLYLKREASRLLFASRRANALAVIGMWITFFLIASLGGYIAVAGTIGLATVLNRNFRRATVKVAGVGMVLFFGVLFLFQDIEILYAPVFRVSHFLNSLVGLLFYGETVSGSIGIRLTRLYWAVVVWLEHPLFGVGINNIVYLNNLTEPTWYEGYPLQPYTHSVVGFILSSAGFLGFLTYGAIYATAARYLHTAKSKLEDRFDQSVVSAIGYAIFANAITGFISVPLAYPLKWFLFALLSILVTYATTTGAQEKQ